MDSKELIRILRNSDCEDGFACIFNMFGKTEEGYYGCFAEYPHGDKDEPCKGCIAHQAADLIEKLLIDSNNPQDGENEAEEGEEENG